MDPTQFFAASRLIIVAGKGGVGKTTASAALSVAAAKCGLSVLLVALDAKTGLSRLLGCEPLDYEPVEVPPLAAALAAPGLPTATAKLIQEHLLSDAENAPLMAMNAKHAGGRERAAV